MKSWAHSLDRYGCQSVFLSKRHIASREAIMITSDRRNTEELDRSSADTGSETQLCWFRRF